jgi:hypothetical protein
MSSQQYDSVLNPIIDWNTVQNEDAIMDFLYTDEDTGQLVDFTGWEARLYVTDLKGKPVLQADSEITTDSEQVITLNDSGVIQCKFAQSKISSMLGSFRYDLSVKDPNGVRGTWQQGVFRIEKGSTNWE